MTKSYHSNLMVVKEVSFSIRKGECLGLVGESGSGKSTLARCLLGLEGLDNGEVQFLESPLQQLKGNPLRKARRKMQAVFQQPGGSLNPKLKIMESLMEPCDMERALGKQKRRNTAKDLLEMVSLPLWTLDAYPHELSGGMTQRVNIARAISTNPALIILDEPTASLDVSVQASILNLFKDLQDELGIAYLFISHDLAATTYMSDRIMVMKEGRILDSFQKEEILLPERDLYTQELIGMFL
ncbi:ABC transporter ATP-binding protein [Bacillus sp. NTK074B]|uniref:ABC transporter ATP-binding protein n=1 Tax=Bacillus sp. NTK074B TaxID=2802174 RepID=UPI001A8F24D4|nr:ABC transporter ATP-binding protein [Bacillus sp. NTK074B]